MTFIKCQDLRKSGLYEHGGRTEPAYFGNSISGGSELQMQSQQYSVFYCLQFLVIVILGRHAR